jgi:hypothetical protein
VDHVIRVSALTMIFVTIAAGIWNLDVPVVMPAGLRVERDHARCQAESHDRCDEQPYLHERSLKPQPLRLSRLQTG